MFMDVLIAYYALKDIKKSIFIQNMKKLRRESYFYNNSHFSQHRKR